MVSGDGLLVRVRGSAHALRSEQVRGLARLAAAHGNGQIELTRRANLQLRGVREDALDALQAGLVELALADPSTAREARPGLLVDPLHGLVAGCSELAGVAGSIERALAACAQERTLSPKLGVVLDAGSGVLHDVEADIRIELGAVNSDHAYLRVATAEGAVELASVRVADVPPAVSVLVRELAADAGDEGSAPRMRDLVHVRGLAALRACIAQLALPDAPPRERRAPHLAGSTLGFQHGSAPWLGLGIAFGSAPSATWLALAELAERCGSGALRLSPAREVLLPGVCAEHASTVEQTAQCHALITRDDDLRRRVIACAGAPACSSAWGETRALATALAESARSRLASGGSLHVSGCSKGCAWGAPASLTVVLAEGGAHLAANSTATAACGTAVEPISTLRRRLEPLCRSHAQPQQAPPR